MARKPEYKLVYKTKKEAQRWALTLLDRDFKVKLNKVRGGYSVVVY